MSIPPNENTPPKPYAPCLPQDISERGFANGMAGLANKVNTSAPEALKEQNGLYKALGFNVKNQNWLPSAMVALGYTIGDCHVDTKRFNEIVSNLDRTDGSGGNNASTITAKDKELFAKLLSAKAERLKNALPKEPVENELPTEESN